MGGQIHPRLLKDAAAFLPGMFDHCFTCQHVIGEALGREFRKKVMDALVAE